MMGCTMQIVGTETGEYQGYKGKNREGERREKTCCVELWKQSCRVAVLREVVYAMRCPMSKEEQGEGSGSLRIRCVGVTVQCLLIKVVWKRLRKKSYGNVPVH